MVVTIIGYRGTGKSTISVPLAKRLGFTAVDADEEIERRAGCSIREIFARQGEPGFRALERDLMAELLSQSQIVVAAGGGAVLDPGTRQKMISAGPVVWLRASVETIERRILEDAATAERRPDLTTRGGRAEIEQLLKVREPLYRQSATIALDVDDRDTDEVVQEILRQLPPNARGGSAP